MDQWAHVVDLSHADLSEQVNLHCGQVSIVLHVFCNVLNTLFNIEFLSVSLHVICEMLGIIVFK